MSGPSMKTVHLNDPLHAVLAGARAGRGQFIKIVAIILHCPGEPDRLVFYDADYGEGTGEEKTRKTMRQMRPLLEPSERLSLRIYKARFAVVRKLEKEGYPHAPYGS